LEGSTRQADEAFIAKMNSIMKEFNDVYSDILEKAEAIR
jgi:hypothetical protein